MSTRTIPESPLPKASRFVISIYLFGAPALLMLADSFHYYHHYLIANVIFKMALVAFIVGSFGLAYLFPDKTKYFGLIGTGMVALGAITISAMSTETLFLDLINDKGYSAAQVNTVKNVLKSTEAMRVIYLPSGFAFPLGLVALSIGIFRTPYTPRYIALILCAGAIFHTIARFVNDISLLLLSEIVLLTASSLAGWFMWRYKPKQKNT
ncbi:MAG: hypothetical protein ABI663_02985 [Chryseolinea sp.]